MIWHGKKGKKPTGGRIKLARKKRKYELGNIAILTAIGEEKRKILFGKGGIKKVKAFSVEFANVLNPKTNEIRKVKILSVIETPSTKHLAKSNIITKGAIIKTEIGNARVTSRPSQHGVVNAVLIES